MEVDLEPVLVGTEGNDNFDENTNMAGYYRSVSVGYRETYNNLYNNEGVLQSGTCNTRSGCTFYDLIQFYNDEGAEELYDKNQEYYYLVTRDTNILVMSRNTSSTWSETSKPFTLTGIYNGTDYGTT